MTSTVSPIPEGYPTVTPYLIMRDADDAILFYQTAFGAELLLRLNEPSGKVGHAEVKIGSSVVMLAEENTAMGYSGPETLGASPVSLLIYTEDVDAFFARALSAGGQEVEPIENKFYGDRMGSLRDPFGYVWFIASRIENLTVEEIEQRMKGGE